jgi:hypothetical protein
MLRTMSEELEPGAGLPPAAGCYTTGGDPSPCLGPCLRTKARHRREPESNKKAARPGMPALSLSWPFIDSSVEGMGREHLAKTPHGCGMDLTNRS